MIHPIELERERLGFSVAGLSACNTSQPSRIGTNTEAHSVCHPCGRHPARPAPHTATFEPRSLPARGRPSSVRTRLSPGILGGISPLPAVGPRSSLVLRKAAAQSRRRHRGFARVTRFRSEGRSGQAAPPAAPSLLVPSRPLPSRAVPRQPRCPPARSMLTGRRGRPGPGQRAGSTGGSAAPPRWEPRRARGERSRQPWREPPRVEGA